MKWGKNEIQPEEWSCMYKISFVGYGCFIGSVLGILTTAFFRRRTLFIGGHFLIAILYCCLGLMPQNSPWTLIGITLIITMF